MTNEKERLIEYIEIPNFFSMEKIDCHILREFLINAKPLNNKISMNFLRNYYNEDRKKGYILIRELEIRGFYFNLEKQTSFIKNVAKMKESKIKIIYTDNNSGKHKKVRRDIFREFINKADVESDYYFNLIPIHTLSLNNEFVEKEFIRYGYEVLTLKAYKSRLSEDYSEDILITDIKALNRNNFTDIINLLKSKGILYLSELEYFDYGELVKEQAKKNIPLLYTGFFKHTADLYIKELKNRKSNKEKDVKNTIKDNKQSYKDKDKEILIELSKIVKQEMSDGFSSTNKIFEEALYNSKLNEYINDKNLKNGASIANLIKQTDDSILVIDGQLLSFKGNKIKSIEDYIYKLNIDKLYEAEIYDILLNFDYKVNQLQDIISNLLNSGKFIKISKNRFQKTNTFKIKSKTERLIVKIIKNELKTNGFVSLKTYERKFSTMFAIDDNIYNQYTLKYILENNGMKSIKRFNEHSSVERIIMVDKDFRGDSLDVLVHKTLKNNYQGSLHETDVYDYLSNKGIYEHQSAFTSKVLKSDITCSGLVKVDIARRVVLK